MEPSWYASLYRLFAFDLDGTLVRLNVDWGGLKRRLEALARERLGQTLEFSPLTPALERVLVEHGRGEHDAFVEVVASWEVEAAKRTAVPNWTAIDLLKSVHAEGKLVAVVTNNATQTARAAARRFGFLDCVDLFVGKGDVERLKPDPAGLLLATRRLGVPPGETLFVGDSDEDEEAAKRAGVAFLRACW
ncbi:MAG: HAD hydrolase-like protein [Promethearchaeota archaeon]